MTARGWLVLLLLLLPGWAVAQDMTRFKIASQTYEVPVRDGFCASDDPRLKEMAFDSLSGLIAVLSMHVRCPDLEQFQATGQPDQFRIRFWGVMVDQGRAMTVGPEALREFDALRRLIHQGTDEEQRAVITGIQQTFARDGIELHCLSLNSEEDILGGNLCTVDREGRKVDLAGAFRPLQGYLAVAVVMHVPGGGPFTPDFSQAEAMLSTMKPVQ